jgi:hypothetical protein
MTHSGVRTLNTAVAGWKRASVNWPRVFAIDVAAYAVMSNHYHVVLRVDDSTCKAAGAMKRCCAAGRSCSTGPLLVQTVPDQPPQRALMGQASTEHGVNALGGDLPRPSDLILSWFMRVLNESIARQANAEDKRERPLSGRGASRARRCWTSRPCCRR